MKSAAEWLEDHLRRLCGEITPDKRIIVVLSMFLLFTGMSLYFTISSIYRFGKGEGERLQIQRIEMLELELRQKESELDSIKHFNRYNYEYERESEQGSR